MVKKPLPGVMIAVLFISMIMLAFNVQPATADETITGNHITIEAPEEYISRLQLQLNILDDQYEALLELVGEAPYEGQKIGILYDSSIENATAYAGNPIRVGEGFWDEVEIIWGVIGHELGHDFSMSTSIDKVVFPISPFYEAVATFLGGYTLSVVLPKYYHSSDDYYKIPNYNGSITYVVATSVDQEYFKKALDAYVQTSPGVDNVTVEVAIAMLLEIANTYGWDSIRTFCRLCSEVNQIPWTPDEKWDLFVHLLSVATGVDLVPLFRDNWNLPVNYIPTLAAPTLTATPGTVDQGQTSGLTSSSVTTGASPYVYQWFEKAPNGSYVPVGTNSANFSFVTSGATATGSWSFILQVTDNTGAAVNSSEVSVTVNFALVAPTVSASLSTVDQGQSSSLSSTGVTTGASPYTYQWLLKTPDAGSYSAIRGAASPSYTFTTSNSTTTGTWSFELQVTDSAGAVVTSNAATVTVNSSAIPEFPTISVFALSLVAMAAVVVFLRRRAWSARALKVQALPEDGVKRS